jgi:hypothetical protein
MKRLPMGHQRIMECHAHGQKIAVEQGDKMLSSII